MVFNYYYYYYYYYHYYHYHFHASLYADVNGFLNPTIITGENYRPDLLFLIQSKCLYVLEQLVSSLTLTTMRCVRKKNI